MQQSSIANANARGLPSAGAGSEINQSTIANRNVLVYGCGDASAFLIAYTGRIGAGRARSREPRLCRLGGRDRGSQIKADRLFQQPSVRSHLGYLTEQAVTVSNVLPFSRPVSRPQISPELQAEIAAIKAMSSATYKPTYDVFGDWSLVDHHGNVQKRGGLLWAGHRYPIIPGAHGLACKAAAKKGGRS